MFVGAVLLFGGQQFLRYVLAVPGPALLTAYLGDLTSMPIILTLALFAQRRLVAHSRTFVFPDSWLLLAWLSVAAWFEVLLSVFSARAVADPFDVGAYALGTLAFRHWLNRAGEETGRQ
ncbi:hypothetical protein GCM10022408_11710 [Hymenobacter fastidiosus]|uniref:Magnesium citrate secondary transporter n=1 Tax=Hymenobacter fastidiosus TaxID=486264 RepID=A0ABP7RTS6_9BACT